MQSGIMAETDTEVIVEEFDCNVQRTTNDAECEPVKTICDCVGTIGLESPQTGNDLKGRKASILATDGAEMSF